MPLTLTGSPARPELVSQLAYQQLEASTRRRFADIFQIPSYVAIDGMRFTQLRATSILRDKALIPSIVEQSGFNPIHENVLTHFLKVNLPAPFAQGVLYMTKGDQYQSQYQCTLQFIGHPSTVIAYETQSEHPKNVMAMISHGALFGSLPRQTLARITGNRPLVLIEQTFSKRDQDIGYHTSRGYKLQKNSAGVIIAREIHSADGILNNSKGREKETRRVIGQASEVFFLVD